MFNKHPLISRFLVFIFIPGLLLLLIAFDHLKNSLPVETVKVGSRDIPYVGEIHQDIHGVKYIESESDEGAYFFLGYSHAQDRMWQLEVQRRIARGQMSEIFGKDAIDKDHWMRTLGLYESAESAWSNLSLDARASLSAYSAGINYWLKTTRQLPIEFEVLGISPKPWTEIDSLAWIKVFALMISSNMNREIINFALSKSLNKNQIASLLGHYPDEAPVTVSNSELASSHVLSDILNINNKIENDWGIGGKYAGSNAWVISGKYTKTGSPMLANDPHLGLQIPSLWYAAQLKGKDLNVDGMTLVGIPLVIFGKNENIAWGGTAMIADVQDLYFERLNPENSSEYYYEGKYIAMESRVEHIAVKADFPAGLRQAVDPVKIILRKTRNGPVVSDVTGNFEQPVSLRWTALEDGDTTYDSFYKLAYASNWNEFKSALSLCISPALNMLYVDGENNIGYMGAGKIPVRKKGEGQMPAPAWDDDYIWSGFIPFEEMPQSFNPPKGYIVSANNKVVSSDYPYFISNDWAPPERASRIDQLINEKITNKQLFVTDDMASIQGDIVDLASQKFVNYLRGIPNYSGAHADIFNRVKNWGGDMSKDSVEAAIFFVWMKHLRNFLYMDELGGSWSNAEKMEKSTLSSVWESVRYNEMLDALTNRKSNWCDNVNTDTVESCDQILFSSLDVAVIELKKLKGTDEENWKWGDINKTVYDHTPFSQIRFLKPLFGRDAFGSGSSNTINVANARYFESIGYLKSFGAGFRQIIEIKQRHLFMLSTGQSGNFMSNHYDDMISPFANIEYINLGEKQKSQLTLLLRASEN